MSSDLPTTWSISIPDSFAESSSEKTEGGARTKKRIVLWSGNLDCIPSIQEIHTLFSHEWSENIIVDIAAQILRHAPTKFISSLLSCLTCNYWRNKSAKIDMRMLNSLKSDSKPICGCVFKKGEIIAIFCS